MSPLKVIVIGGGFAGMVCARVLREHHDVTILEQVPHPHIHGSGVNLGPTAIRILTSLGFSRERAKSTVIERFRRFDRLGGILQDDDMNPIAEKVGAPWYTQLWVDGWNELMRLATAPSDELGISGKQPKFIWGAKVVDADIESGEVLVADGRKFQGDLIIGADGVNSTIRRLVVDQEHLARAWPTGTSAFRLTIMASEVNAAIGKTRIMDPDRPPSVDLYLAGDGSRRGIIMYPCRQYEVLNINCIAPDSMVRWPAEAPPNMPADLKNLTEIFSDFGFVCKSLLGAAKSARLYQLRDEDPLPTYTRGCALLVGDAAHAMTPHQGQASSQSIEDAEALRLFCKDDIDVSSIQDILRTIDRVRRPRASHIQKHSRAGIRSSEHMGLLRHMLYNWQYPGIEECVRRMKEGEDMFEITNPFQLHWVTPS